MLSALVAGHRRRASRAPGGSAQMCAHQWPGRLPNPVETVRNHLVVHIWYLVTKTAALHAPRDGRIGTHSIWHNICVLCVCAELDQG
eukprot:6047176-Prymnesium_polylepis.1